MVHLVHENIWTTKTTMIITKRNEQMIDDPVGSIGFVFVRHLTYGLYVLLMMMMITKDKSESNFPRIRPTTLNNQQENSLMFIKTCSSSRRQSYV
ncbi:hypothetical protein BLOT_001552 [Blomia tropicalis]|nr:hypothetical protein BLOT_001552 [Blomia tropicalis]